MTRVVVVLGLLGILFGLCLWYGSLWPDPAVGAYPESYEVGPEYDRYIGERVTIGGRIAETDPVVIMVKYGVGEELPLRVTGLDASVPVREGDHLQIHGIAEHDRTVRALNAFAVTDSSIWSMFIVSFLAGLWVLTRIIRHWRFDRRAWVLQPRDRPLNLRKWMRSRVGIGGQDA